MFRRSTKYAFIGRVVHSRLYRTVEVLPEGDVYSTTPHHSRLLIVLALIILWVGALGGFVAGRVWATYKQAQPLQVSKTLATMPSLNRRLVILDAMREQHVLDDWRLAFCSAESRRLDAVDPISGKRVSGFVAY